MTLGALMEIRLERWNGEAIIILSHENDFECFFITFDGSLNILYPIFSSSMNVSHKINHISKVYHSFFSFHSTISELLDSFEPLEYRVFEG